MRTTLRLYTHLHFNPHTRLRAVAAGGAAGSVKH